MELRSGICILICILVLTAGCTALDETRDSLSVSRSAEEYAVAEKMMSPAQAPASAGAGERDSWSTGEDEPAPVLSQADQKIIRTADIAIEVMNVSESVDTLKNLAESAEGIIQGSSISAGRNNEYQGTVTIRIPTDRFDAVLQEIRSLGRLTSSSISAEDVTEEYVDLNARKGALETQLAQYNRILTQAVNVSEVLQVQREIERVQVEIDRITGRMKYLDSRISFSTITVRLSEPDQVVTSTGLSAASVITEGISGFIGMVATLVILVMTFLPVIIIIGAVYYLYRRFRQGS